MSEKKWTKDMDIAMAVWASGILESACDAIVGDGCEKTEVETPQPHEWTPEEEQS